MTHSTVLKATMAGIAVLVVAQVLYIGVMAKISHHELLRLLLLGSPALAAFTATYLAGRWKWLVGMSMAIYGAIIGVLSASGYEYFGLHADSIGGPLDTFFILLVYQGVLSFIGSVAGIFLSRQRKAQ